MSSKQPDGLQAMDKADIGVSLMSAHWMDDAQGLAWLCMLASVL